MEQAVKKIVSKNIIAIELIVLAITSVGLLAVVYFYDLVEKLYAVSPQLHKKFDLTMLAVALLSIALMIFSIRRWRQLRTAYKSLAKSDEQVRFQAQLLNEIGDGLTATDLEGNITYVNRITCRWAQKTQNEIIGTSVISYGEDASQGATQKEIIENTRKKGLWAGEVVNIAKNGRRRILECHTWLMKDESGNPIGMCGASRDITERKFRELELTKHKKYLEALDKAAGILLESMSQIQYESFLDTLGQTCQADRILVFLREKHENGGKSISNIAQWHNNKTIAPVETNETSPIFKNQIWPNWKNKLCQNQTVYVSAKDTTPDEQKFWKELQIKSLLAIPIIIDEKLEGLVSFDNCKNERRWTDSEIDFLHTATQDLANAIKRIEFKTELKQQRDFASRLIETAQTIILVLDNDGNVVTFNPYFEKLSGYKLEEVKGKNWFETFLPQKDQEAVKQIFKTALADTPTTGNTNSITTKTSQLKYIEWFDKTLKDSTGKTVGLLATGHDITERLKAAEKLKKAHEQLEDRVAHRTAALEKTNAQLLKTISEKEHIRKILRETEKLAAVGKMAAQVAHEINNPIAGIKNAFLLIKDAIPADCKDIEYVGRIEKEIDRVANIVKQLFDLYRPDIAEPFKFVLCETVKDIVEMVKMAVVQKHISVKIECEGQKMVLLSEALLRQVIYNLMQNAIQASGNGATIKINASTQNSTLKLSVNDQGPGIDKDIQDKIFEPFFTTGMGGPESGLGLGLAITKDIITAMDGTIDFVSEKNKGTTFNISIPIPNEEQK